MISNKKRPILAGAIGNFIEVYDYSHFMFFAPIIASVFFPQDIPALALTFTFSIYAIERLVRPIVGVWVGRYVDHYGRSKTLYVSVIGMIITGILMALLPSYKLVGYAAPIALLVVRLFQGMLISGEFVNSMVYIYEHASKDKKGVVGSIVFFSGLVGCIFSSGLSFLILFFCSKDFILSLGWRIPYLIGVIFLIVSYSIRKNMVETPDFLNIRHLNQQSLTKIIGENKKPLLLCFAITAISAATYSFLIVYMPSYLHTEKHFSLSYSSALSSFNLIFYALVLPIMGYLSDKFGRRRLILLSLAGLLILNPFLYSKLSDVTKPLDVEIILLIYLIIIATLNGPMPAFVSELFQVNTRTTCLSLGYGISLSIFGGITPIICSYLPKLTNIINLPAIYIFTLSLIALSLLFNFKNYSQLMPNKLEFSNDHI